MRACNRDRARRRSPIRARSSSCAADMRRGRRRRCLATAARPCADSDRATRRRGRRRCGRARCCHRGPPTDARRASQAAGYRRYGRCGRKRKWGQRRLLPLPHLRTAVSQKSSLTPFSHRDRLVLPRVDARTLRLVPWIGLAVERELQSIPQRAPARGVVDDLLLHVIESDARDKVDGPLELPAFLAIELQERTGVLEHFLARLHLGKELRAL